MKSGCISPPSFNRASMSRGGEEPVDHRLGPGAIAATKEVQVVQHMVEVVEIDADGDTRIEWPRMLIGGVKPGLETAEEPRHRDVSLAVAEVNGGIEYDRRCVSEHAPVAAPKVAVQRRGQGRVTGKEVLDVLDQPPAARLQPSAIAIAGGEFELESDSTLT